MLFQRFLLMFCLLHQGVQFLFPAAFLSGCPHFIGQLPLLCVNPFPNRPQRFLHSVQLPGCRLLDIRLRSPDIRLPFASRHHRNIRFHSADIPLSAVPFRVLLFRSIRLGYFYYTIVSFSLKHRPGQEVPQHIVHLPHLLFQLLPKLTRFFAETLRLCLRSGQFFLPSVQLGFFRHRPRDMGQQGMMGGAADRTGIPLLQPPGQHAGLGVQELLLHLPVDLPQARLLLRRRPVLLSCGKKLLQPALCLFRVRGQAFLCAPGFLELFLSLAQKQQARLRLPDALPLFPVKIPSLLMPVRSGTGLSVGFFQGFRSLSGTLHGFRSLPVQPQSALSFFRLMPEGQRFFPDIFQGLPLFPETLLFLFQALQLRGQGIQAPADFSLLFLHRLPLYALAFQKGALAPEPLFHFLRVRKHPVPVGQRFRPHPGFVHGSRKLCRPLSGLRQVLQGLPLPPALLFQAFSPAQQILLPAQDFLLSALQPLPHLSCTGKEPTVLLFFRKGCLQGPHLTRAFLFPLLLSGDFQFSRLLCSPLRLQPLQQLQILSGFPDLLLQPGALQPVLCRLLQKRRFLCQLLFQGFLAS